MSGQPGFSAVEAVILALLLVLLIAAFFGPRKRTLLVADRPEEPYRVYTQQFDQELHAREVVEALPTASLDSEKGWLTPHNHVWRTASDQVQPIVDARRDNVPAWSSRWRSALGGIEPEDCAVALLIDQSGSMKGEPIEAAAAAAQLIDEALSFLSVTTEILGFSTAGWHGGKAARLWQREGRSDYPGRLAALMHIVYKSADEAGLSKEARDVIVHPDLLRENIDGEALLWANGRLDALPQKHKMLLVISDGAPVDDITLTFNGATYLWRHLLLVLGELNGEEALILGGVGIEYRVSELYPISARASELSDLPDVTAGVLEQMFREAAKRYLPDPG